MADIDIDLSNRDQLLELINVVPARIEHMGQPRAHNSGVYANPIPYDPMLGIAAIDYQEAESRGYFKIDLLNVSVYQLIKDPAHYEHMITCDPPWCRLWQDPDWSNQITHIGAYQDLLRQMQPDSIIRMAAFVAIIRPGKAHLQNRPWSEVLSSVWDGDNSRGFCFKKSHSIAYAHLITLHMNLLNSTHQRD